MTRQKKSKTISRAGYILPLAAPGSTAEYALKGVYESGRKKYASWYIPQSENSSIYSCTPSTLQCARSIKRIYDAQTLLAPDSDMRDVRVQASALFDTLTAHGAADVYAVGDVHALRWVSRCALYARETKKDIRWAAIPCCAVNSVPQTLVSCGFGAALSQCVEIVNAFTDEIKRIALTSPVGICEIQDDTTGWLAAGSAAVVTDTDSAYCYIPSSGMTTDTCKEKITHAIRDKGYAIILTNTSAQEVKQICELERIGYRHITMYPREYSLQEYVSRRDRDISISAGKMAVRAIRHGHIAQLVIRRAGVGSIKEKWDATPLADALSAVRSIPAHYLRSRVLKPSDELRKMCMPFLARVHRR